MKIKCIAIDDEPLALQQISTYIERTPFLDLIALCHSAFEAYDVIENNEIDLMFVDVNLPDLNGLDFIKSLSQKPLIVFTTAYSEYAFEGFQVDAIDYLLKPISQQNFLKAANKAKNWLQLNENKNTPEIEKTEIFVKSDYKMVKIRLNNIHYVESANEYVKIHLDDGSFVTTFMRLKVFEEFLPAAQFMRIHRSFIIPLEKISAIERNRIYLGNKVIVPVGEQYRDDFQHYIDSKLSNI